MSRVLVVAVAWLLCVSCGPPKPAVTVPAPAVIGGGEPETAPAGTDPTAGVVPPQPTVRLPRNFLPTQYTAKLAIDPRQDTFAGSIEIAGTVTERSTVIWLHGYHLKILRASAVRGTEAVALTVTQHGEDLLQLRAVRPLEPGPWTIALDYRAELDAINTSGAFKQTVAGNAYVFTQLEAVYARRVFPCFDEPDSKVPWQLTLDVPRNLTAVSNAPQVSETPIDPHSKRVEFAVTKPLPTYLVAFGIGPFEILDAGKTKRGTPVRIVTLANRGADAAYARQTTTPLLELAEEWFGTPYPYEKLDMLTIPLTVGFGAMENAGLITFTETLMLLDPQRAAKERQRAWVVVAAHEIAHQWFGNLVTPVFWDDIWLNEGFATWVAVKLSAKLEPTWRDLEGAIGNRNYALLTDSLVTARRIRQPIDVPDDILNAFDRITYNKGAAVLSMFEAFVGPAVFQQGVRDYLASRAWGNATSRDFVAAIAKASGKDVIDAAFSTFLDQAGAPELTATTTCAGGKATVALSQRRYVAPGSPEPPATTPWIVPVCVAYDKGGGQRGDACTLLDQPTGTLALETRSCPRWVLPNAGGRGYYRLALTPAQVTGLRDAAWPKLTWQERATLHFEVGQAATTGKLPLALALSFVPKMLAGNDRFTVIPAIQLPLDLAPLITDDLRPKYELWLRQRLGPAARRVGVLPRPTDTLDIEEMREHLIDAVGWHGRDPALIAEAVKLADRWRELPQSIRGPVLAIAVDARPEVFERVLREVGAEPDRTRRNEMHAALARVRDVGRKQAVLALILDPARDMREMMKLLWGGSNDATRALSRRFFREHKDAILARVPKAETTSPLAGLAWLFTTTCRAEQRDAIADYVTKTFGGMAGGARVVQQAIEGMDQCIAKRKLLDGELRAWLGAVRAP
ncbi:MAG: ERAP1-like C-terminal domain-containing protein [Myxococcota bacterium]|nr:ERAP1-like C-terminal domain-containing protein [Myxococcota bacterium]